MHHGPRYTQSNLLNSQPPFLSENRFRFLQNGSGNALHPDFSKPPPVLMSSPLRNQQPLSERDRHLNFVRSHMNRTAEKPLSNVKPSHSSPPEEKCLIGASNVRFVREHMQSSDSSWKFVVKSGCVTNQMFGDAARFITQSSSNHLKIVFHTGTNDLEHGTSNEVADDIIRLVRFCHNLGKEKCKTIDISVCSIIPRTDSPKRGSAAYAVKASLAFIAGQANLSLKRQAQIENFKFLDLQNVQCPQCLGYDRVHYRPSAAGIVAKAIMDSSKLPNQTGMGSLFHCTPPNWEMG
jgi:hypothetical protein